MRRGCGLHFWATDLSSPLSCFSWLPFHPCGPSQSYKRAIGEVSEKACLGAPCRLPFLLWHPSYLLLLPFPLSHASLPTPSPQDFVLLKERALDDAPRPPKKAMDYSSSSEEVESSEDEDESNGEPSEGSRDPPGARYGGAWGWAGLPLF